MREGENGLKWTSCWFKTYTPDGDATHSITSGWLAPLNTHKPRLFIEKRFLAGITCHVWAEAALGGRIPPAVTR